MKHLLFVLFITTKIIPFGYKVLNSQFSNQMRITMLQKLFNVQQIFI